ncbi:hypothetical protein GCM10028807_32920 [Spirosoma daeguense]
MDNLIVKGQKIDKNWLVELATTTRYSLDDLNNAFYLIKDKDKFLKCVDLAATYRQSSVYSFICDLIANGIVTRHL